MDPNLSSRSGAPGDPGSHLQFQISLLRLMAQKSMAQKSMGQKMTGQKALDQKARSKAWQSVQAPSAQVMELERLQHAGPGEPRVKTRS
jgi:hypothetical protein